MAGQVLPVTAFGRELVKKTALTLESKADSAAVAYEIFFSTDRGVPCFKYANGTVTELTEELPA